MCVFVTKGSHQVEQIFMVQLLKLLAEFISFFSPMPHVGHVQDRSHHEPLARRHSFICLKLDTDEPVKGLSIQRVITFGAGKHLLERLFLQLGFALFLLEMLLRRWHV